MVISINDFEFL